MNCSIIPKKLDDLPIFNIDNGTNWCYKAISGFHDSIIDNLKRGS